MSLYKLEFWERISGRMFLLNVILDILFKGLHKMIFFGRGGAITLVICNSNMILNLFNHNLAITSLIKYIIFALIYSIILLLIS